MAITHGTATRIVLADAVVDRIDLGSGTSTGKLRILTSGDATLVDCNYSNPAFGAANGSAVATANTISTGTATGAGTAAKFNAIDRDGNIIFSGSVGTSGSDINLSSTTIAVNDQVSISSQTYTASA